MKKIIILVTLIIGIILPYKVHANELNGIVTDTNGNKYYYINGIKQTGFQYIEGKTYFFSRINNNEMRTGTFAIDGSTYYFDETTGTMYTGWYNTGAEKWYFDTDGKRASGFKTIEGKTYFFSRNNNNPMRTGIFVIDGSTYYFDETTGAMYTGWYNTGAEKWYFNTGGKRASGFKIIEGKTYFFSRNNNNPMRTGIFAIDGSTYYFDETTGAMYTGWYNTGAEKWYFDTDGKRASGFKTIEGKTYFFSRNNNNPMRTGIFVIDGSTYYFDETTGAMYTGWYNTGAEKWYFNTDGKRASGFKTIEGKTYFFSRNNNNPMRTGIFAIDGSTYYFDKTGVMQTGYQKMSDGTRYFSAEGKMQIGITTIEEKKYYFNNNGIQLWGFQVIEGKTYFFSRVADHSMRTGYFLIDNYYYYFNDNGIMQVGFHDVEGIKRFFSRVDGKMRTGWVLIDGNMYYFEPTTGEITIGNKTIDNVNYYFQNDGKLKDGFVTDTAGNTRYYYLDGSYANSWVTIAGTKYFFNSLGVMIGKNVKKVIDISAHQNNIDWDTVKAYGDVDAVILRVAAGSLNLDSKFERNISELNRLGIPYGIYLYSYAENQFGTVPGLGTMHEGALEAQRIINAMRTYNVKLSLPIYYDLEVWENRKNSLWNSSHYKPIIDAFDQKMKESGYNWQIYTNKNWAETALIDYKDKITWIAQYNHFCTYQGNYNIWQYTSTGQIPGITGNVDVNVWF